LLIGKKGESRQGRGGGGTGYLQKEPAHRHISDQSFPPPPATIISTPKNSSHVPRQVRQAKLMAKREASVDRAKPLDIIEWLERFGITADKDREFERLIFSKC